MSRLDESTAGIRTNAQRPGKYLNAGLLSPERNPGGDRSSRGNWGGRGRQITSGVVRACALF